MKVTVYSVGCPQCKALETMLKAKKINFDIIESEESFKMLIDKGFKSLPVMGLEDGTLLKYKDAIDWIKQNSAQG